MAAKLRKREEIPAQYKWDLSHIYPDDAAWEAALADVLASGKKFAALEGKVAENPRQAIREYFDLNQQAERKSPLIRQWRIMTRSCAT